MTSVYYKTDKTDTSGPVWSLCTPDGRIDFSLLGQKFGFDPTSIELNGLACPMKELESKHKWKQIRDIFKEKELPVGAEDDPVVVTGEAAVPAVSTEGEPLSKKTKRSPDEFQFSVPAEKSELVATQSYFKKLLEAPVDLPTNAEALREFLSATPIKLPVLKKSTYTGFNLPDYVAVRTSEAELDLAAEVEVAFHAITKSAPACEATSSARLYQLTGSFLEFLDMRLSKGGLVKLSTQLDTVDTTGTSAMSALKMLERPDFLCFVKGVLILRWENKFDYSELGIAMQENASKLRVWSPLYYGNLPYVIGGCCAGQLFQWLKLAPNGKKIAVDPISDFYDLTQPRGVALLLHSTIRMHCLLQRLQKELTGFPPVKLYTPIPRDGGEVIVYPDQVKKTVTSLSVDRRCMLESLYASIKGCRYLIQLKSIRAMKGSTIFLLEPVGDPNARPLVLEDLEAAVHDILHGIVELHQQGYTHRDLRWENFIKVNVESEWKWMVIDLEAADLDEEEWVGDGLRSWDVGTLEDRDGKKIYTKGSDMYQLGKLIVEWLEASGIGGEGGQAMMARGVNMQRGRGAAAKVLEDICQIGCERCGKFDAQRKRGL